MPTIAESRKKAVRAFRKRSIKTKQVLRDTTRIADEMVRRLETDLFSGHNFVDDPHSADSRQSSNPALIKDLNSLTRVVVQLTTIDYKLKQMELKDQETLSSAEEFQLALEYVKSLSASDRIRFDTELDL